jgi:hypothetical protein
VAEVEEVTVLNPALVRAVPVAVEVVAETLPEHYLHKNFVNLQEQEHRRDSLAPVVAVEVAGTTAEILTEPAVTAHRDAFMLDIKGI